CFMDISLFIYVHGFSPSCDQVRRVIMKKRLVVTRRKRSILVSAGTAVRLGRESQVGAYGRVNGREALADFDRVLELRHYHYNITVLPVGRGGNLVVVGQLQGGEHAQDLDEVAPGTGRVGDDQAHLLVRVDDEQRAHGQGVIGVGVDQVVEFGHAAVMVGADREAVDGY